jgi:dTDP-4-amino-4,6-dideoxygalactose transaminase
LPFVPDWADPVWHLFVVRHPQRNSLQEMLTAAEIGTLIHYPVPPHRSGAYSELRTQDSNHWNLPIADEIANSVLSIPMGPHLTMQQYKKVSQLAALANISTHNEKYNR